jgi:hypothetical protein
MLNIHMDHIDWCKGVQDELKELRADLDKIKCSHTHFIMDGKQKGWRCYCCGQDADLCVEVTRKGEAYHNGFRDGLRAAKGGA